MNRRMMRAHPEAAALFLQSFSCAPRCPRRRSSLRPSLPRQRALRPLDAHRPALRRDPRLPPQVASAPSNRPFELYLDLDELKQNLPWMKRAALRTAPLRPAPGDLRRLRRLGAALRRPN